MLALPLGLWVLETPLALVLLVVPLGLLLLARRPARPRPVPTGTLFLWRALSEADVQAGRSRRRIPAWLVASCVACAFGALALAGPRAEHGLEPARWEVVLDRGPGMGLPWLDPKGAAAPEGSNAPATRGERALRAAQDQLARWTRPGDRVLWRAPGRAALELAPGEAPPAAWCRPARREGRPAWERYARAGTLWVTDRRPVAEPGAATRIVAGGAAVPGPVAALGDELLSWSPEGDAPPQRRAPGALVLLPGLPAEGPSSDGSSQPGWLEELIRAWARARGLGAVRAAPERVAADDAARSALLAAEDVVLVVEGAGQRLAPLEQGALVPETRSFALREGGIELRGRALSDPAWAALQGWPGPPADSAPTVVWSAPGAGEAAGESVPLLATSPGWARWSVTALEEPGGDPAALAVRVGALLDAALLPPPGVVPRAARASAGPPERLEGAPAERRPATSAGWGAALATRTGGRLPALFAGLAALAAIVALALHRP